MNYYNENDPKCAQWLRALIEQGSIPRGYVDERNIQDVKPAELSGYRQCHFFAGIGGWSLALRIAGIPDTQEIWTMSCPCQPFSVAGQGMGEDDPRHLWPYARNLVGIRRPPIVIGEQVAKANGFRWLSRVRSDMEKAVFAFGASDLCSAGVRSPNIRQRLYWFAVDLLADSTNPKRRRGKSGKETAAWQEKERRKRFTGGGAARLLGDASGKGLPSSEPQKLFGKGRQQEGRAIGQPSDTRRPPAGGMGDSKLLRRDTRSAGNGSGQKGSRSEPRPIIARPSGASGDRMDHPEHDGLHRQEKDSTFEDGHGPYGRIYHGSPAGFWSRYSIVQCRDGKARRFEPESFPLVNGFPARMAVLKGFGNAINPVLAAEFIQAAFEAMKAEGLLRD